MLLSNWRTSKRILNCSDKPLVMGILNVTPDSFSDGGQFLTVDEAIRQAEIMIAEGTDIIDIGGESTRPGSKQISAEDESNRTIPVIEALAKRFDVSLSIDTTKSEVARRAIDAGAEIINDISGLRFDERIAEVAAHTSAGLVLMHSRGTFESMHSQEPVDDILTEIMTDFRRAIDVASSHLVKPEQIVLDIGIGFGKTVEQNLELLGKLDKIKAEFDQFPLMVGASRKSFIGKLLNRPNAVDRLNGSISSVAIAVFNGAKILRVHDVKETVEAIKIASAIEFARNT